MLGVIQDLIDRIYLLLHQVAKHLVIRIEVVGDQRRGGVGTVSGTEGVINVHLGEVCQFLDKSLLARLDSLLGSCALLLGGVLGESHRLALLLSVEAKVLQEERLAVLELHRHPLRLLTDAVGSELHVHAEQLRDVGEDVLHRELGVGAGLRATEV